MSSGSTRITSNTEPLDLDYGDISNGWSSITNPEAIEDGKKIILYAKQFSEGNILRAYDTQAYTDNPEFVSSCDYLHLIKCKFTK